MTTTRADVAELDSAAWAEQHPPESIRDAATWSTRGGDCPLTLAGAGAPLVSEFCIAEFAAAIGRSTDFGRIKMAHGLEFKYRLARHWDRVRSGTLEPWRACRVAAATLGLTKEAATYVDAQLASFAHKVGPAQLDRLVEQAIARFMPAQAAEDAEKAAEDRHVTFHHHQVSLNGTTWMQADLDLADALDLDAAISAGAEARRLAGSTESLDVRRAAAGGALRAPLRGGDHRQGRRTGAGTGQQPPSHRAHRPGPCLVRERRHLRGREAGDRPRRAHRRRWLRGPPSASPNRARSATAPAPSPGAPAQPSSATPNTSSPRAAEAARVRATLPRCAAVTIGSRPIRRGRTRSSTRAPTAGRVPTATSSSATDMGPPTSLAIGHPLDPPTHPTPDRLACHAPLFRITAAHVNEAHVSE